MICYVVDASVAVEYLLRTPLGLSVAPLLDEAELSAPELMDAEVLSILRRAVRLGVVEVTRAVTVLQDLQDWPIERWTHRDLLATAWKFRHNLSAYDALYVAVALQDGAILLTCDGPLARAPVKGITVQNVTGS